MHRGFNFYYREGLKKSAVALYRNKCFFRFVLYFLAELFGRILIFFNPHFNLADTRQGYVIRKTEKLSFSSSFRDVGRRAPLGVYALTLCLEGLILVAGVAASAALAAMLGGIGYAVGKIAEYGDLTLFVLAFAAPAGFVLAAYLVVTLIIFSPTAYIISNNEGVTAGETIGACYRSMLNSGKWTVFFSYFISLFVKAVYLAAAGAGGYFAIAALVPHSYFAVAMTGWAVLAFLGYLTFAPIFTLANRVVKEHLFEDIVLDPATCARTCEKVNVSSLDGKRKKTFASEELSALFEYAEDPYRILEITKAKELTLEERKEKISLKEAPSATVRQPAPAAGAADKS